MATEAPFDRSLSPEDPVIWTRRNRFRTRFAVVLAASLVLLVLVYGWIARPALARGEVVFAYGALALAIGLFLLENVRAYGREPGRVGASRTGVRVDRGFRVHFVPWTRIYPVANVARWNGFPFEYHPLDHSSAITVLLSFDQLIELTNHPAAPRWPLAREWAMKIHDGRSRTL